MGILTAAEILGAKDTRVERLEVPEWGGAVCLRTISGNERDAFEAATFGEEGDTATMRGRFAVMVVCDEQGNRLFQDGQAEGLGQKSAAALERIFEAGRKLNGMSRKDVEELEKNCAGSPSGSSGSTSPSS